MIEWNDCPKTEKVQMHNWNGLIVKPYIVYVCVWCGVKYVEFDYHGYY